MKRFLIGLLFLAAFGMALAQPPADYQLWCGEEIIGVVSITEDNVHVAVLEGVMCDAVDVTPEGAPFEATLELVEGVLVVTLTFDDDYFDDPESVELTLDEVPQEALDGMLLAQKNRAMAMELRDAAQERAQERGAGMRPDVPEDGDDLEVEADDGPPGWLELPEPARAPRP